MTVSGESQRSPPARPIVPGLENVRDRMEEADRGFFERVEQGYRKLAVAESGRIRNIDASQPVDRVTQEIWKAVEPLLPRK